MSGSRSVGPAPIKAATYIEVHHPAFQLRAGAVSPSALDAQTHAGLDEAKFTSKLNMATSGSETKNDQELLQLVTTGSTVPTRRVIVAEQPAWAWEIDADGDRVIGTTMIRASGDRRLTFQLDPTGQVEQGKLTLQATVAGADGSIRARYGTQLNISGQDRTAVWDLTQVPVGQLRFSLGLQTGDLATLRVVAGTLTTI